MSALGTGDVTLRSEGQGIPLSPVNPVTGAISDAFGSRTVSYDCVSELVAQLIGRRLSGTVLLLFDVGLIISADLE